MGGRFPIEECSLVVLYQWTIQQRPDMPAGAQLGLADLLEPVSIHTYRPVPELLVKLPRC